MVVFILSLVFVVMFVSVSFCVDGVDEFCAHLFIVCALSHNKVVHNRKYASHFSFSCVILFSTFM